MNKNIFKLLITLISAACVLLILFQSIWIRESLAIKKQQFDGNVTKSLDGIVSVIEKLEIDRHLHNISNPTSAENQLISENYNTFVTSKNSITTTQHEKRFFKVRDIDSLQLPKLKQLYLSDTIFGYKKRISLNAVDKKRKFNDVLPYQKKLWNKNVMVEQTVNNLIQIEMDIEDRVNNQLLDSVIISQLNKNYIFTDFIYRVTDNSSKTILASDSSNIKLNIRSYNTRLFPNDEVSKPSFLELYFPSKRSFLISSIWPMLFSSISLSLIIITTFYYTLRVIVRQKKLSEIKNDFVNNMTHELKTPIATISLAAQMISDKNIPDSSKNFLTMGDIIYKESKRLGFQVEKVLQMATLEKGEIQLKLKEINIHNAIEGILNTNKLLIEQNGGRAETLFKADKFMVKVDEVHFINIISNLIENAIKYSKENLVISLATKSDNNGVIISIKDNGIGIKKEDQKRIFDQFFRVHTGNIHDVKGFGLGLSYVKKIIDLHGGNISVDSKFGEGTTFVVFFPFILKRK